MQETEDINTIMYNDMYFAEGVSSRLAYRSQTMIMKS